MSFAELVKEGRCGSCRLLQENLAVVKNHQPRVCELLAQLQDTEALQWVRAAGLRLNVGACEIAIAHKHVRLLRLLCKWDFQACITALRAGLPELFEWAVGEGFPWDGALEIEMYFSARA